MQISKLYLPLGAVVVLLISSPVVAQETAAQAQAREALRQKMLELDTQQAGAATVAPAAPGVVVTPEPPVVVVAPAAAPVVSTESAAAAAPMDEAQAARAREALRQKMLELDAQPGAGATTTAPEVTFTPTPVAASAGAVAVTTPPPATSYKPIEVPASSLSGTKEARLATLLQQYKADQITPAQYHTQRAAIIAEP